MPPPRNPAVQGIWSIHAGVSPLSRSTTGTKTWDYNFDGVAHYGMFVDYLRDVRTWNPAGPMRKADAQKARVP